jgi:hypothetical protein
VERCLAGMLHQIFERRVRLGRHYHQIALRSFSAHKV